MNYKVIIPARRNSKRLPGKNKLPLNGIPLFMHSVHYAINEGFDKDDIIVTTDDEDISAIADEFGVIVHKRSEQYSGDLISSGDVLKNVWQHLQLFGNNSILLQPTSPVRPKNLLNDSIRIFEKTKAESLYSVSVLSEKVGHRDEESHFTPINFQLGQRSQDMQKLFFENGLVYITSSGLIKEAKVHNIESRTILVDSICATVDIDDLNDFLWADFVLKQMNNDRI